MIQSCLLELILKFIRQTISCFLKAALQMMSYRFYMVSFLSVVTIDDPFSLALSSQQE